MRSIYKYAVTKTFYFSLFITWRERIGAEREDRWLAFLFAIVSEELSFTEHLLLTDIHTQILMVTVKELLQKFYDSIQNIPINDDVFFWFLPFSKDEVKPFTYETFNSAAFLFNLKPLSICNGRFFNVVC